MQVPCAEYQECCTYRYRSGSFTCTYNYIQYLVRHMFPVCIASWTRTPYVLFARFCFSQPISWCTFSPVFFFSCFFLGTAAAAAAAAILAVSSS